MMTEIEKKALALVAQLQEEDDGKEYSHAYHFKALCRAIEQHEAYKQEVSDEIVKLGCWPDVVNLDRFIIPKPVDPLVEALSSMGWFDPQSTADDIRTAMQARGYEWRKIGEGA